MIEFDQHPKKSQKNYVFTHQKSLKIVNLKLLQIHPFHEKVVGMEIPESLKKHLHKSVLLFFIKIPSGASESRPQISHLFRIRSVFRVNLSLQCCVFLLAKPKAVESHSFAKRSSESSL